MEPISLGAVFASIGSAFKFADLAIRISEVGSENEVFVRTIQVVRDDLNEVERLLNDQPVQRKLTSTPGKLPWVKAAVINTKSALNEIGRWVERARSEQESTGDIRFETRVRWVFNDHEKLVNRKTELMTCHQQLSNVLSYLQRLEDVSTTPESPNDIDTTFFDDILSRNRRQAISKTPLTYHNPAQTRHSTSYLPNPQGSTENLRPFRSSLPTSETHYHSTNASLPPAPTPYLSTPPCSPPPAYSSIMHDTQHNEEPWRDISATSTPHRHSRRSWERDSQSGAFENHSASKETKDIRAYEIPSRHEFTPELAGDTVSMSGTNSLGPVNPFDFSNGSFKDLISSKPSKNEPKVIAELLGNLSFPAELPAESLSPPPGYPPRPSQHTSRNVKDIQRTNARLHDHRSRGVELPSIARRKPVSVGASTGSTITRHSIANPISSNTNAYEKISVSMQSGKNDDALEMPASSQRPLLTRHSYTPYSCPDIFSTTSPLDSETARPSAIPSAKSHSQIEVLQNVAKPVPPTLQNTPVQQNDRPSVARMRRQKDMMNLLGSIEF